VRRWHVQGHAALEQVTHHRPGQDWAPHWHEEWSVGAVLHGSCRYSLGGQPHTASAGDVLAIAPGVVHTCGLDRDGHGADRRARVVMVYAGAGWLASLGLALPAGSGRLQAPALAAAAGAVRDGTTAAAWLAQALPALAAAVLPPAPPHGDAARRVLAALQRSACGAAQEAIGALARDCGLSREHFHRTVLRSLGLSPGAYLRAARMAHARRLLIAGASIAQAAQGGGFADQAHFTRWFSRCFGYTPGALANCRDLQPRQAWISASSRAGSSGRSR